MAIDENKLLLRALGNKIREARLSKGYSQKEFSNATSIEKASLSRIENGRTNPSFITLSRICDSLNIAMTELVE